MLKWFSVLKTDRVGFQDVFFFFLLLLLNKEAVLIVVYLCILAIVQMIW